MERKSDWHAIYTCVSCNDKLRLPQIMHNQGVCPKCGYLSEGTVCDTDKIVVRYIYTHPRWKFWVKTFETEPLY